MTSQQRQAARNLADNLRALGIPFEVSVRLVGGWFEQNGIAAEYENFEAAFLHILTEDKTFH